MGLNIACFCMMRNESPIIEPFLDQCAEFFDTLYLVDHSSTDKSLELAENYGLSGLQLFNLVSRGYPQSELATFFAHHAFDSSQADYVFFLDCDEFLPFSNRAALEAFLLDNQGHDIIELPWLNICPNDLAGGNIFERSFRRGIEPSKYVKVILSKSAHQKADNLKVHQGYHAVVAPGHNLTVGKPGKSWLLHIPIRSRVQITFKLVAGHNRLVLEGGLLKKKEGTHWKDLANELRFRKHSDDFLVDLALNYPAMSGQSDEQELDFTFPYIKSKYMESSDYVMMSSIALLSDVNVVDESNDYSFTLIGSSGKIMLSDKKIEKKPMKMDKLKIASVANIIPTDNKPDVFSNLIEPLFSLPTKMPTTAWSGHIPFLFVLFKLLRPRSYVELGVHNGASFIAACTAAKQYQLNTQLFGIDCWFGDDHAGHYDGDDLYNDLRSYTERTFENARLIRSYFHEARPTFSAGSIDLLHIDGLHTYEAVKEDFDTWVTGMSSQGVVMFHDTNVHDRGFGVHRLWKELSENYFTLEFFHSHGLGVLFLDSKDPRIALLSGLKETPEQWLFYRDLISLVAQGLPERMGWADASQHVGELERRLAEANSQLDGARHDRAAVLNSTSWRLTRPLRALISRLR
ncbi:hypothetical protein HB779_12750 [Phyllobacterium sp. 628]|uniref:class I SAM-dependent methyltransferase n=1 Tax=Phyllobacterium sp. 628 TaxID=2718938 RepID=UPI0016627C35|nr:class I SAM-dependent methyltransferase [Phyllobacterium sp. 628]QND52677.1 hypothetical protein HB779_12750 [Phyllobacterium sp. 628]